MPRKYSSLRHSRRNKKNSDPTSLVVLLVVGLLAIFPIQYFGWRVEQALQVLVGSLIAVLLIVGIVGFWLWRRRVLAERTWSFSKVDHMTGLEFEQYLQGLLTSRGFRNVQVTQASGDFGADLVGVLDGEQYVIQAKQYNLWKPVGISAVQQVVGALPRYRASRSMVITTGNFTQAAQTLAKDHSTVLVARNELKRWIAEYQKSR